MQTQDFNIESKAPVYGYKRSPVNERAFLITKKPEADSSFVPVGDYTILDRSEDIALAEKKVINLVSLLNGRKRLVELGHETKSRVLYQVVSEGNAEEKAKILFYHLGEEGVSKENALFRLEKDENVWN